MPTINRAFKEISCKIVYYGPGLGGKTTNLQVVHKQIPTKHRGELVSLATEQDRTLFFDFLPLDLGEVKGFKTKFQLYTVPGQVFYNATRKLVLRGVDGVVFVADSQSDRMEDNIDSLNNLNENLQEYGLDIDSVPIVLQYNKRDLPNILSVADMNRGMNPTGKYATTEAVACDGVGVKETLKAISGMVLTRLNDVTQNQRPGGQQQSKLAEAAAKRKATGGLTGGTSASSVGGVPPMPPTGPSSAPAAPPQSHSSAFGSGPVIPQTPGFGGMQRPGSFLSAQSAAPAAPPEPKVLRVKQEGSCYWRGFRLGASSLELVERRSKDGQPEYHLSGIVRGLFRKKYWSKTMEKTMPPPGAPATPSGYEYLGERTTSVDRNPKVELWLSLTEPRQVFAREVNGSLEVAPSGRRLKEIL